MREGTLCLRWLRSPATRKSGPKSMQNAQQGNNPPSRTRNGAGRRRLNAAGTLPSEASARLRDHMLDELTAIGSSEAMTSGRNADYPPKAI